MTRTKFTFRLRRAIIVLLCLTVLVALMQGASWFSRGNQQAHSVQLEELSRTLARQVAFSVIPMMKSDNPDSKGIQSMLNLLTSDSRILDATVYDASGTVIARSGENIAVRDRLALDGQKAGSYFNQQIVVPIEDKNSLIGHFRLTLDTHTLATEAKQVDNTTNLLRLMLLLAVATGLVLGHTLLQGKRSRWQQSPYLLTANNKVNEEEETTRE